MGIQPFVTSAETIILIGVWSQTFLSLPFPSLPRKGQKHSRLPVWPLGLGCHLVKD